MPARRYLGVHIVSSRVFKCSLQHAKHSFYRGANAIFGKVGRIVSEEVVLHLIERKCLPAVTVVWPRSLSPDENGIKILGFLY